MKRIKASDFVCVSRPKLLPMLTTVFGLIALVSNTANAEEIIKTPQHGLIVRDGRLYKNDAVYRGIGVNYCDLFQERIHNPQQQRTLIGLRRLGERGIPFVRFWACGFWPKDWNLYFQDKDEWFRRLDEVVQTAEHADVGLIPSLFWRTETYPDLFDEFDDAWADPNSQTRQFMSNYTAEVVIRYKDSLAIWGWEFANELNLRCDLPNGWQMLANRRSGAGKNRGQHARNLMTYEIAAEAFVAFAKEVRRHDPHRLITTGNSRPRESAWHNATEKKWTLDNAEQAFEVFGWMSPEPIDTVSIHFYPPADREPVYARVEGIEAVIGRYRAFARRLGQPLFVGEFAAAGHESKRTLSMEQFRNLQTEILDAFLEHRVDLAAHWVFDYTADREGPGLVRPGNEYVWILDQLVRYNRRIDEQLSLEAGTAGDLRKQINLK